MLKIFKKSFSTLIIPDPNSLSPELNSILTAGKKFNEPIDILHLTKNIPKYKNFYSDFKNEEINKILLSENKDFDGKSYETSSNFITNFLQENNYKRIIMSNSFIAKEILPRLSVKSKSQAITDIIEIIDDNTFIRPIYAGNALAKIKYNHSPLYCSIRVTNFEKTEKKSDKEEVLIKEIKSSDYLKDFE